MLSLAAEVGEEEEDKREESVEGNGKEKGDEEKYQAVGNDAKDEENGIGKIVEEIEGIIYVRNAKRVQNELIILAAEEEVEKIRQDVRKYLVEPEEAMAVDDSDSISIMAHEDGEFEEEEEEKKDAKQEKEKPSKKRAEEDIKQMKERGGNASTKKKASGESSRKITMKRKIEDEVTPNNSFTDMMAHLQKLKEDILKEVKENISPVHPAPPDQSGN